MNGTEPKRNCGHPIPLPHADYPAVCLDCGIGLCVKCTQRGHSCLPAALKDQP